MQINQTTTKVVIDVGGVNYRITKDLEGGIRINKVDFSDSLNSTDKISINPSTSNEIILK